ncbi:capsular polysaccharide biosynthesis protein [Yokenella regensburgei]|uniref:capsular polysaccharide biosynthesis protein n=1 Tax=Yokenella regensburgei TaxID=158877 RepID=UPI003F152436
MLGIFSGGIWRIPYLGSFLPGERVRLSTLKAIPENVSAVAVWGYRPSAEKPTALAKAAGVPVVRLEDGFIRSAGLGVQGCPPLSMVIDYAGIYYDASTPSSLEQLIQDSAGNQALSQEAQAMMHAIVDQDLSKYNQAPPFVAPDPMPDAVLVVDQTFGDVSVTKGNASAESFLQMLECAKQENPNAEIWVKVHPDVLCGKKSGYFSALKADARVRLFAEDVSPQSLLRHMRKVYVVTSQYGFEALLAGKTVVCFGQPWYAGWGLTDDRHPQANALAARRQPASLIDLFTAAYLRYSHYRHPVTGEPASLGCVVDWLSLQRRHTLARRGVLWAPGLSLWKTAILKPYLKTAENEVRFARQCPRATALIAWGTRGEAKWQAQADAQGIALWRMEDGFIRSSGLGSDLLAPLSLVLDKCGIYYDASRPSDLENLLNASQLSARESARAHALRLQLVRHKVSKYNLGNDWQLPAQAAGKKVILVPGQVEDDASIATGALSVRTNGDLLRTVRQRNPDAFIVFKPHPDVLVGNRKGQVPAEDVARWADCQALDADIIQCIQHADELHTMTSLSGFEALMHGKKVYCYGMPFYAGWGLTSDEHRLARRTRQLSLDDLVWQTLIAYPTYIHPQRLTPMTAEEAALWLISAPRGEMKITPRKIGRLARQYRKVKMFYKVRFG